MVCPLYPLFSLHFLMSLFFCLFFFFFNDTATTEIYTLSLHDALPISEADSRGVHGNNERLSLDALTFGVHFLYDVIAAVRSEEHTSELQSRRDLVCRLL